MGVVTLTLTVARLAALALTRARTLALTRTPLPGAGPSA